MLALARRLTVTFDAITTQTKTNTNVVLYSNAKVILTEYKTPELADYKPSYGRG